MVGATDSNDALASFSSRGPVSGNTLIRPDISAPGVGTYSAVPMNAYGTKQGTSMATPHVAGVVALFLSAYPSFKGYPDKVAAILRATAITDGVTDPVAQSCGGTPQNVFPNYMMGYGRIDAWAAFHEIVFINGFDD